MVNKSVVTKSRSHNPAHAIKSVILGLKKNKPIKSIDPAFIRDEILYDIFNAISDPVFVKNSKHHWILLNDAFCRFKGHSREELIGKSDFDFFPKKEAEVFWAKDEEVLKSGKNNINEECFTDAKGQTHTIITKKNVYKNDQGDKILVGIIHDITEEKRVSNRLKESEEKFKNAFDSSSLGMALVSPTGKWIQVNPAICAILGYSAKELLNLDFKAITYPDEVKRDLGALKNMVSGLMNNYDVEKRYITKAGKTIWVSLHTSLVRDSSQKPLYFVTEIENIEKRKEIENELKARLEELEKLNKLLVGRELKMIDLKNTIERLKKQSEKK